MSIPPEELEINVYDPDNSGFCHKAYNGVSITHLPTGTVARYHGSRSQHVNRAIAMDMILSALTHPRHK